MLLLVSLLAVVLLAKKFSLVVDAGVAAIGAPPAFAGILVALLILLPESVAAVAAARKNDLQKSINLALGSSLATIGLTIPAVAVAAYVLDKQLVLGLSAQDMVLLVLTFIFSMLTFGTGRTNILFGLVHWWCLRSFVFLVFVPLNRALGRKLDECISAKSDVQIEPRKFASPNGGWRRAAPPAIISTGWTT